MDWSRDDGDSEFCEAIRMAAQYLIGNLKFELIEDCIICHTV